MSEVFLHSDYKGYLNARLDTAGRGARSRLSQALGCQTAYTAQVLRGSAHFSLEQSEHINRFLGHNESEGNFYLLMVQHDRAGSESLRARFRRQLDGLREQNKLLKNRLDVKPVLTEQHQIVYYSSWIYGAIHALVSVPGFQTPESIAERLGLEAGLVAEAIEFLRDCGLLTILPDGRLTVGTARLHLPSDSPLIAKHHINWRLQALRALERRNKQDLHYSSIVSLSKADAERIREMLITSIQNVKAVVRDSPEEEMRSICVDFFTL